MTIEELLKITFNPENLEMTNFADFKSAVQKHGFSLNNFYDVIFEINPLSSLYRALITSYSTTDVNVLRMMRLYTDECTIPGIQMSTGEYRINNTPQLKYVYGSVLSETNFSFIMDADSTIKKLFDIWTAYMHGYAINSGPPVGNGNSLSHRMRTRYRDDYAIDIIIIKYEKPPSSRKNYTKKVNAFRKKDIIPDILKDPAIDGVDNPQDEFSNFYKAVPVHSTRLFKAFPSNIASVPLNSGASSLNKLSVSFEYESFTTSALTGFNSVFNGVRDAVNH